MKIDLENLTKEHIDTMIEVQVLRELIFDFYKKMSPNDFEGFRDNYNKMFGEMKVEYFRKMNLDDDLNDEIRELLK